MSTPRSSTLGAPTASASFQLGTTPRARHRRLDGSFAMSAPTSPLPDQDEDDQPGPSSRRRSALTGEEKDRAKGRKGRRRWDMGGKGMVKEGFRQFGEHCARNQIRTLLIDCLVMTNLFYPSLAIYLQKRFPPLHPPSPPSHNTHRIPLSSSAAPKSTQKEHPLSLLSTPVLDSFFPYPPPLLPRLTWAGWWGTGSGPPEDEVWSATRLTGDDMSEEVKLVRVGWADVGDVLDRDVTADEVQEKEWLERDRVFLDLVRHTAEGWAERIPALNVDCVRRLASSAHLDDGDTVVARGECHLLTASPTEPAPGLTPLSVIQRRRRAVNETEAHTPDMIPVGWMPQAGNIYHSVGVLFRIPRGRSTLFEEQWASAIASAAEQVGGEVFVEAQGRRGGAVDQTGEWSLSWHPPISPSSPSSDSPTDQAHDDVHHHPPQSLPPLILLLYTLLFLTLAFQLSNASKVHSRWGLAFTGIVQLCCSSVMSFSVLALLGWNGWGYSRAESSLPTYVLPFVIVVVGAENMATLTKAVFSVPFTYSVPVRIGLGLSKVGTKIALTSLTDLLLLGLVWLFVNLKPVREFCLFAAVVIITDWFMLHTFFLTVLSIDAQRLELADVLASNGGIRADSPRTRAEDENAGFDWRKAFRARTTKSGSLYLLLISVGIIYYFTERHRSPHTTASLYGYSPPSSAHAHRSMSTSPATPFSTTVRDLLAMPASEQLWRSLNPLNLPSIRLSVPPASIVVLPLASHPMVPSDLRKLSLPTSRLLLPRLKPLFYLFKVVILPQAVTATALYVLLLYLLKDSDLLDAQRNKLGRGEVRPSDEGETDGATGEGGSIRKRASTVASIEVDTLPCSHQGDVEVLAVGASGKVAVSAGMDGGLVLWRFEDQGGRGTGEALSLKGLQEGDAIAAAAVSADSKWVCAGTYGGWVHVWEVLEEGRPKELVPRSVAEEGQRRRIVGLSFDIAKNPAADEDDPFLSSSTRNDKRSAPHVEDEPPGILVICSGAELLLLVPQSVQVLAASNKRGRVLPLLDGEDRPGGRSGFVVSSPDTVTLYLRTDAEEAWSKTPLSFSPVSGDTVTCAFLSRVPGLDLLALGYQSGQIDILDLSGHPVASISPTSATSLPIRKIQLACPPGPMRCIGCGTSSADGFFCVSSTDEQVYVDRLSSRHASPFCRCPTFRRPSATSLTDRSSRAGTPTPPALLRKKSSTKDFVVPPLAARGSAAAWPSNSPKKSPSLLPPVSNGEFPLSVHGGTRRLSNLHRDDPAAAASWDAGPPSPLFDPSIGAGVAEGGVMGGEYEIHPLGSIRCSLSPAFGSSASWSLLQSDSVLLGLSRAGPDIGDAAWQIWTVDLASLWNGTSLVIETANLRDMALRTADRRVAESAASAKHGVGMKERQAERLRSLSGRVVFPPLLPLSMGGGTTRRNGESVGTYAGMAYVELGPWAQAGEDGVMMGLGNRVGRLRLVGGARSQTERVSGGVRGGQGMGAGASAGGTGLGVKAGASGPALTPPPPPPALGRRKISEDGVRASSKKAQ